MIHEGYHVDDQIRTKPTQMNLASGSQSNAAGVLHNSVAEMQQYSEAVSGQPSNEVAKPTNSGNASLNSSQNPLANARMLPPGNNPGLTDVSRTLVWGFNAPEVTTAGPTIITSSSSSSAAATTTTAATATTATTTTTTTATATTTATTTTTTTTTTAAAATTAAATTTTTKPTSYDSTAASPVPEVTYDAWTNYTFTLRAESQHTVGQSHEGFPTSGVTAAAATATATAATATAATNAKEIDDGTWNSCGCGKHGQ